MQDSQNSTSNNDGDCSQSNMISLAQISKREVIDLIRTEQIEYLMNKQGKSPIWSNFYLMMLDNMLIPFVKCINCESLLSYDTKKSGTSHLSRHSKDCNSSSDAGQTRQLKLTSSLSQMEHVSLRERQGFADLCAEWSARDLMPLK